MARWKLITLLIVVCMIGISSGCLAAVGVTIHRDSYGVPHIYANSLEGLYYGFGYSVAQDRLFQLEMLKRITYGKVSEVCGADFYQLDVLMRRDFPTPEKLQELFNSLDQQYINMLVAYADGINAWIDEVMADKEHKLPLEFYHYGFEPSKWTGIDVTTPYLAIFVLFMDLSNEMINAEFYTYLVDQFGQDAQSYFDDMVWGNDPGAITTIPSDALTLNIESTANQLALLDLQGLKESSHMLRAEQEMTKNLLAQIGMGLPRKVQNGSTRSFSYSLAVGADKSKTGEPLLMGGPQFDFWLPSLVHEVGLHGFGIDVVGSTLTGNPFVMFGYNKNSAFTSTAGAGNIQDIFEEKLNPENPLEYKYKGQWVPMSQRVEKIYVKGESEPREATIYTTVHGPVVATVDTDQDGKNEVAYTKKLACFDEYLDGIMGFWKFMNAKNPQQVIEAGATNSLSINFIYADKQGNIGIYHCGHYPERVKNYDRRLPVPGTGEYDWIGYRDPMQNPHYFSKNEDYLVNWNNKPSKDWANDDLSGIFNWAGWSQDHRASRIMTLVEAKDKIGVTDIEDIIHDIADYDLRTMHIKDFLLIALQDTTDAELVTARNLVESWSNYRRDENGDGYYDSVGITIWSKWWAVVNEKIFADELGNYWKVLLDNYAGYSFFYRVLLGDEASLPVKNDYFNGAEWETVFVDSMKVALKQLKEEYGTSDMSQWVTKAKRMNMIPSNPWGVPMSVGQVDSLAYMDRGTQNHIILLKKSGPVGENVIPAGQNGFINKDGVPGSNFSDQLVLFAEWRYKKMNFTKSEVVIDLKSTTILSYQFVEKSF